MTVKTAEFNYWLLLFFCKQKKWWWCCLVKAHKMHTV